MLSCKNVHDLPTRQFLSKSDYPSWSSCPFFINVLIANSLVTCNQTVASPECVVNVVNSMKINNVRLINQNVPTVKENTPIMVIQMVALCIISLTAYSVKYSILGHSFWVTYPKWVPKTKQYYLCFFFFIQGDVVSKGFNEVRQLLVVASKSKKPADVS
jgi:hypothetical protein